MIARQPQPNRDAQPHSLTLIASCAFAISLSVPTPTTAQSIEQRLEMQRHEMVRNYIETEGIEDPRVLAAMRRTPRHEFMLTSNRRFAYEDGAFPIGHGQTISPPFVVAYMTQAIKPDRNDRVLEIGTGSGYQAAVLSEIVKHVYTIEIVRPLGQSAKSRLKRLGYKNVSVRIGDGYEGWEEHAPFDKIIVTCSPENVPVPLVQQLKEGGKMIIPLGERYQQVFYLFEKKEGRLQPTELIPTLFVPMTGESEEKRQVQPNPKLPEIRNGSFDLDSNKDGRPDSWHYQRLMKRVAEGAKDGEYFIRFESDETGRPAQALQGMAIDGRAIARIRIRLWMRYEDARRGKESWAIPGLMVHFYDQNRRSIGDKLLGPWIGDNDWERTSQIFDVPIDAREAIIRVGLNGGTGILDLDGIEMERQAR